MEQEILEQKPLVESPTPEQKGPEVKQPERTAKKKFNWKDFARNHLYELVALGGFLFLLILFSFLPQAVTGRPYKYVGLWRKAIINNFVEQTTVYMVLAIGATFIYSMGTMDIAVGYQVGIMATVFVTVSNATGSIIFGLLVALIIALVCSVFNGLVGAYVKLPTVMSSVILMQFFRGLMTNIYQDDPTNPGSFILAKDVSWATSTGFRVFSLVILLLVGLYILGYTKLGKRTKAIGANRRAADLAGAQFLKSRIMAYAVFGFFLVIAVFFLVARTQGIAEGDASTFQMDIMIMLLMGGMPLSGGMRTKLINAVLGTLTYALITIGLTLCGVPEAQVFFTKAIIFVTIVVLTCRKPGEVLPR